MRISDWSSDVCSSDLTALINNDKAMAREVIFNEKRVNAYELRIDKDCENIITLQNPMAHDMRFVFATLKINSNMERIGDNAEEIERASWRERVCQYV